MINQDRLVQTFLELVQLDSESKRERQVADYVKEKLINMGYTVQEDNAGAAFGGDTGNVIASLAGNAGGKSILLCAHMDTVVPGLDVKPVIKEGVITSSGGTVLGGDDKAGIAAILEAVQVVQEKNMEHGPIQIIFTVAEEIGLLGANHLQIEALQPVDAAFFFDSEQLINKICIASPYHLDLTATFTGKAAHAGMEPEKGISAIAMAADAIYHMPLGRIDEETTANIGIIQGGRATNIVTETAVIRGEARSLVKEKVDKQIEHMADSCRKAAERFHGMVDVQIEEKYAAIDLDPDSLTVQIAITAARELGLEPKLVKSGGGSDANVFCGKGIPAANLGIGMNQVHTLQENIRIEDLAKGTEGVLKLIEVACRWE